MTYKELFENCHRLLQMPALFFYEILYPIETTFIFQSKNVTHFYQFYLILIFRGQNLVIRLLFSLFFSTIVVTKSTETEIINKNITRIDCIHI